MKVGDKIRILEDRLACANVKAGDILEIRSIDEDTIYTSGNWRFQNWRLGDGFEILAPENQGAEIDASFTISSSSTDPSKCEASTGEFQRHGRVMDARIAIGKPAPLTRRERFAMAALNGILSGGAYWDGRNPHIDAVGWADALIAELDRTTK